MFVCNHLCPANSIDSIDPLSCSGGMRIILISLLTQIFSVRIYVLHHACAVGHIKDSIDYVCLYGTCLCMHDCLQLSCPSHMHSPQKDRHT